MQIRTQTFKANAADALADGELQRALGGIKSGLVAQRRTAYERLPEFEALRDVGRDIRDHVLRHLDLYLEAYERNAIAAGAKVHWARDGQEAREIILGICRDVGAKRVTKGKSMVSEEIALNDHLEAAGLEVVETDLGEYILQIRHEAPSHIIAPAIHLTQDQVEADFRRLHTGLDKDRVLPDASSMVLEARQILREKFLSADVGITGANFLIAETGSSVIVTNEGNGDLTQSLPKVHVVIASIEKVVPTLEDLATLLRLLARSATGQEMSVYTTLFDGTAAHGRSRWAGGVSCRTARQRAFGDACGGDARVAALHPLWSLHEPLPGLQCGWRARLRLGLSRADRCSAQSRTAGCRQYRGPAECLDVLRQVCGRLPDEDPVA